MSVIFLSYSTEDRERVRPLAELLETIAPVWWDPQIGHGERWPEVLQRALDGARCVVVVWTRSSVESDWVWNEAIEGKNRRILVPVLMDDVAPPLGFRHLQAARLQRWSGAADDPEVRTLLRSVAERVKSAAAPDPAPPAESPPVEAPPAEPGAPRVERKPSPDGGRALVFGPAESVPRVGGGASLPTSPAPRKQEPAPSRKRSIRLVEPRGSRRGPVPAWRRAPALVSYGAAGTLLIVMAAFALRQHDPLAAGAASAELSMADRPRPAASTVVLSDVPLSDRVWAKGSTYQHFVMETGNAYAVQEPSARGDTLHVAIVRMSPSGVAPWHPDKQIEGIVRLLARLAQSHSVQVARMRSRGEIDPAVDDDITASMPDIRSRVEQMIREQGGRRP